MQITDEAVEAAAMRIAEWSFEEDPTYKWDDLDAKDKDSAREGMRAALEAAQPHLAPQSVVDREALLQLLDDYAVGRYAPSDVAEHRGFIADAIERLLTGSVK